jgi:hypothetical protein
MERNLTKTADLLLSYMARLGVQWRVVDGGLQLHPVSLLTSYDLELVKEHRSIIIGRIEHGDLTDYFRWPASFDTPEHRSRALPSPDPEPLEVLPEPEPPGGWPFTCDRCGAHRYVDTPIHAGRSIRRDCANCRLAAGFPVWDPAPHVWDGTKNHQPT